MSYVTWSGTYGSNPLGVNDSHIVLANANVADQLVLAEFQDAAQAHQLYRDDYGKPDGRNLLGSIRFKAAAYAAPRHWFLNLLANDAQAALFESLLTNQPDYQSTLIDSWDTYSATPVNVVLSVAQAYRKRVGVNWHLLQFEILEEI